MKLKQILQNFFNKVTGTDPTNYRPSQYSDYTPISPLATPSPTPSPTPTPTPTASPTPTPVAQGNQQYGRNPSTTIANDYVSEAINQAAQQYDVPPALLFDIAMQESSLNPNPPANPQSSAQGLFQFLNGTWDEVVGHSQNPESSLYQALPDQNRSNPLTSALAAAYLIKMGQLGRWDASQNVWGEYWPEEELKGLGFYDQTLNRR